MGQALKPKPKAISKRSKNSALSFEIRDQLYPGEIDFFRKNPTTTGMASEDDRIILNPFSNLSDEERQSVITNESWRLYMRKNNIIPNIPITPDQYNYFNNTPYRGDIDAIKQTITSRFLSGDQSVEVTDEQKKTIRNMFKGMIK